MEPRQNRIVFAAMPNLGATVPRATHTPLPRPSGFAPTAHAQEAYLEVELLLLGGGARRLRHLDLALEFAQFDSRRLLVVRRRVLRFLKQGLSAVWLCVCVCVCFGR